MVMVAHGERTAPALFVGLVGASPRQRPARFTLNGCDRIELGRADRRTVSRATREDGTELLRLSFADPDMCARHAKITREGDAWTVTDLHSLHGTWLGHQRITDHTLADGDAMVVGNTVLVYRATGGEAGDVERLSSEIPFGLSSISPEVCARFNEIANAASTTVPIEITGESGTAKELVAHAIHQLSGRRGLFIHLRCSSHTAIESIEHAAGGTIFLDEVTELVPTAQLSLARAIDRNPSARLVSASRFDLDEEVAAQRFDHGLRTRLAGVCGSVPPLRTRPEDLGLLIASFLVRLAPERTVTFAAEAAAALYGYPWPLNLRELERAIATALDLATDRIELPHLPAAVTALR